MKGRDGGQAGFTLIEISVVLVIIALAYEDGEVLVGIVTQRDLLAAAHLSEQRIDFDDDRPVSEVMNRKVDTVRSECCAAEAARHMLRTKRSCLPVVDETGTLV